MKKKPEKEKSKKPSAPVGVPYNGPVLKGTSERTRWTIWHDAKRPKNTPWYVCDKKERERGQFATLAEAKIAADTKCGKLEAGE